MGKCEVELDRVGISFLVQYSLFAFALLVILISWIVGKKRNKNKLVSARQLLSPVYALVLVIQLIGLILLISATLLNSCRSGLVDENDFSVYNSLTIGHTVAFHLSQYLLLVVVSWEVHSVLSDRLGHQSPSLKTIYAVALGILFLFMGTYTGLRAFIMNRAYSFTYTYTGGDVDWSAIRWSHIILNLIYWILYLIVVIASGALNVKSLLRLRKREQVARSVLPLLILLIVSMFIWTLFTMVEACDAFSYFMKEIAIFEAFGWITTIFKITSFVSILLLGQNLETFGSVVDNASDRNPVLSH